MSGNDLRDLLRKTAAEGSDAVDLAEEVVAERIRSRRARTRRFAGGSVALLAVAVIGGTAWIVHPSDGQPPTAGEDAPQIVRSNSDSPSGAEALLHATLTADTNGCVQASSDRPAVTLVWPRGYTVRGDAKSFEILDSTNEVIARSGVPLNISGGGVDNLNDIWTGLDCAGDGQIWMVGRISPR